MSTVATIPEREAAELEPTGFRLLVRIPSLDAQMKNWANLYMPDETRSLQEQAQLLAKVIAMGPDAYKDTTKFPTGPWCKQGDIIMMRAYSGTRFVRRLPDGSRVLYALINDDTVQCVVGGTIEEIERA